MSPLEPKNTDVKDKKPGMLKSSDSFYQSEEFQNFFKASGRSLVVKADAPKFTILAVSDRHLASTHKTREEVLHSGLFKAYPGSKTDPSEETRVKSSFQQVIKTGESDIQGFLKYELINSITGKKETEFWSTVNEPILNEEGKVAYIINTTENITEQIRAEQEREEAFRNKEALEREQALNEELTASNEELFRTQQLLQELNEDLEQRVVRRTKALQESEARFRTAIEQAPVAIAIFTGPQFIIDLYNKRMLEFWHRTDDQVKNKPLFEVFPESRGQGYEEILLQVLTTGEQYVASESSFTMQRNGSLETVWISLSYDPFRDIDGSVKGIIIMCHEITEQVNTRKHLENIIAEKTVLEKIVRDSEHRLQRILDTMAEGVCIVNAKGCFVYANQMAQRIVEMTEQEIAGLSYMDMLWGLQHVDGSPLTRESHPITVMLTTGMSVYDYEIGLQPKGKNLTYISFNTAPLFNENGVINGGIITFMDVTARRKLMQQKDEFIGVASHELKTPLTALKTLVQLMTDLPSEDQPSPLLSIMIGEANRTANRLHRLINDLLDVNRITSHQFIIRKTNFLLVDMVNECCEHIRTTGQHDIVLTGDLNVTICADEQRLSQVISNLLSNAVKYAPDSKQIAINIKQTGRLVKISITDDGVGISPERLPHIFERYYRASHNIGEAGQGGGLGLGLYISSEIIAAHDGKIGVESEVGKGSTFWITLPAINDCTQE